MELMRWAVEVDFVRWILAWSLPGCSRSGACKANREGRASEEGRGGEASGNDSENYFFFIPYDAARSCLS